MNKNATNAPQHQVTPSEKEQLSIGARIRRRRMDLKIKQKALADELHISRSYMNRIEKGSAFPGYDILQNIVHRLDVSYDYILGGMSPSNSNTSNAPNTSNATTASNVANASIIPNTAYTASHSNAGCSKSITVSSDEGTIQISENDIVMLESAGKTVIIQTTNCAYLSRTPLKEYNDLLSPSLFFETHRGYLVNMNYVTGIDDHYSYVILNNGNCRAALSRRRRKAFLDAYSKYVNYTEQ